MTQRADNWDAGAVGRTAVSLVNEIEELAKAGVFRKAEQARAYLMEKFPMELSAIVSTAELIEEQKTIRIDPDHVEIWDRLYENLSQEEKNALFHSTKKVKVPSGKLVIRQGKPESRLLFIDSGRVTLFHTRGKERILLGQVSIGDFLGDETFFSLSTPTFSAGSQTDVELRFLDKALTKHWEERYPGLYGKIADYCLANSRASQLQQQKNIEKRLFPRDKIDGKVRGFVLEGESEEPVDNFRGSTSDISRVGMSFDIHSSRPEKARALLGCRLGIVLDGAAALEEGKAGLSGTVVKVGDLLYNDFCLHLQFNSPLSEEQFLQVKNKIAREG